jgi:hypothetical protein
MDNSFRQLVQDALDYARQHPCNRSIFISPEEVKFFQNVQPPTQSPVDLNQASSDQSTTKPAYRNQLRNREFDKKTPQHPHPEQATIENRQEISTSNTIQKKPAESKADPLSHFNIKTPSNKKIEKEQASLSEPITPIPKPSEEITEVLKKIAPELMISHSIPDDQAAKKIRSTWKEKLNGVEIVLLVLNQFPDTIDLMKSLAKAIQKDLGAVKLISADRLEQQKRWDLFFQANTFRMIVASSGIEQHPELLKYYKLLPSQQAAFLSNIPLLILEPALNYKDALNKKIDLWNSLCRTFKTTCLLK